MRKLLLPQRCTKRKKSEWKNEKNKTKQNTPRHLKNKQKHTQEEERKKSFVTQASSTVEHSQRGLGWRFHACIMI